MNASTESTVKERLMLFIKHINLSQAKFEKAIGAGNGFVNNISKSIGGDKLQRILCEFPELNTHWLMTGEGEMLKGSPVENLGIQLSDLAFSAILYEREKESNEVLKDHVNSLKEYIGQLSKQIQFLNTENEALKKENADLRSFVQNTKKQA